MKSLLTLVVAFVGLYQVLNAPAQAQPQPTAPLIPIADMIKRT